MTSMLEGTGCYLLVSLFEDTPFGVGLKGNQKDATHAWIFGTYTSRIDR